MAGYSGTPLIKKLGIKEGMMATVVGAPMDYATLIGGWPPAVKQLQKPVKGKMDFIHFFTPDHATFLQNFHSLIPALQPAGMMWVSWPKKASKRFKDLTEDMIRKEALASGLVDVKVCAVTDEWSGLKLVIPLAKR